MSRPLNLARRPFLNTRPVVRITAAFWVGGAILLAINGWLYWDAFFGLEDRREQAAELSRKIAEEERRSDAARQSLRTLDLSEQNARAGYLNQRIAERTFPWSHLFEDLAEVLPDRVRLQSLAPQAGDTRQRASTRRGRPRAADNGQSRVQLEVRAIAEKDEQLFELLDNLFASHLFEGPSLPRENRQSDGTIQFALSVSYLPRPPLRAEAFLAEGPLEADDLEWWAIEGEDETGAGGEPTGSLGEAVPGAPSAGPAPRRRSAAAGPAAPSEAESLADQRASGAQPPPTTGRDAGSGRQPAASGRPSATGRDRAGAQQASPTPSTRDRRAGASPGSAARPEAARPLPSARETPARGRSTRGPVPMQPAASGPLNPRGGQ